MDTWNPYFTVGLLVFAVYVLLAMFGSRERDQRRHAAGRRRDRHGSRPWKS